MCYIILKTVFIFQLATSGKPPLTHVANIASGIHTAGLERVEDSNKTGGEQKETLALIRIHM